jgi:hypothetical protein
MNERVLIVAAITIVAGLLGGFGAYLSEPVAEEPRSESQRRALLRPLLLGVLAAACVPLFLSLVQSELIKKIFAANPPGLPAFEEYLIFTGLCIVAAISSRTFIASVTQRVLQQAKEAKEIAVDAKRTAENAAVEVELGESADEANAPPPAELALGSFEEARVESLSEPISEADRRVLQTMMDRTYRTRTGIAEDSGISRNRISEMLESLADRKLALRTNSPRTGGQRWIITNRGRAALNRPS